MYESTVADKQFVYSKLIIERLDDHKVVVGAMEEIWWHTMTKSA